MRPAKDLAGLSFFNHGLGPPFGEVSPFGGRIYASLQATCSSRMSFMVIGRMICPVFLRNACISLIASDEKSKLTKKLVFFHCLTIYCFFKAGRNGVLTTD
jgi:hypothetical protein